MAASQFFRVAVEGATTDGRKIEGQWIKDIVETFNAKTFTPIVNCEHINGLSPDSQFGSYGTVTAVKAETVTLSIGGKPVNRLALYAQIDANDNLVALNRAGQKLFSSIEVEPDFADSGKAGLLGIAVTNTPASLGTEMMKFAASQGDANPLAHRKTKPTSLFTASEEITLNFSAPAAAAAIVGTTDANTGGFLDIIKALLPGFSQQRAPEAQTPAPVVAPAAATPPANEIAGLSAAIFAMAENNQRENAALRQQLAASDQRFSALTAQLEGSEASGFSHRPTATGADDAEQVDF